ncbi:MFS transporter [Thalassococcus sp. CAU 1522]|uniref:MFS transporter n=1 Tax=Thalassococcus arenae TaxID=2851652 RepID=A0ABS6N596_9RHOB|nr:MFS transporter [Thalassococcus arenae]MBV2358963.1 MFS transporter [Thalassococcus arenae]
MTDTAPRGLIALLSACNFVIGMGAFVVIGLLEPLSGGLGVPVASVGWVLTVYAFAYAVLSPLLVALTGRIGRRRVLFWGLALFALASALAALVDGLGPLLLLRVVAAAGAGVVTPVTSAIAAALSAPEQRGKALAAVLFGLTLSQVAGVPVGGWIAYTFGWQAAFGLVAALALPCLWLVWTRVPAGLSLPPVKLADLGRVLGDGPMMIAVLFTASFLAAIYVPYTFLPALLSETMGYGRDGITLALLVFGAAAVLGNLAGGWLADRIGPARTLTLLCLAQIVLMPPFSTLPMPGWLLLGLVFVWSFAGWSFTAGQQMRLIALDPQRASVLLSLNAAAIYVGIAAGSAAAGLVLDLAGLEMLGIAGGVAALAALAHLLWSQRVVNARMQGD